MKTFNIVNWNIYFSGRINPEKITKKVRSLVNGNDVFVLTEFINNKNGDVIKKGLKDYDIAHHNLSGIDETNHKGFLCATDNTVLIASSSKIHKISSQSKEGEICNDIYLKLTKGIYELKKCLYVSMIDDVIFIPVFFFNDPKEKYHQRCGNYLGEEIVKTINDLRYGFSDHPIILLGDFDSGPGTQPPKKSSRVFSKLSTDNGWFNVNPNLSERSCRQYGNWDDNTWQSLPDHIFINNQLKENSRWETPAFLNPCDNKGQACDPKKLEVYSDHKLQHFVITTN